MCAHLQGQVTMMALSLELFHVISLWFWFLFLELPWRCFSKLFNTYLWFPQRQFLSPNQLSEYLAWWGGPSEGKEQETGGLLEEVGDLQAQFSTLPEVCPPLPPPAFRAGSTSALTAPFLQGTSWLGPSSPSSYLEKPKPERQGTWYLPGGPVFQTPSFQCKGCQFNPCQVN